MQGLVRLDKPFKYVCNCILMQNTGAAVAAALSEFLDGMNDVSAGRPARPLTHPRTRPRVAPAVALARAASAARQRSATRRAGATLRPNNISRREYIYPEILLPWAAASPDSICPGGWGYMSAVCWYTYRGVYEALGVPQGLISNSFGGSRIEEWSSPDALADCPAPSPPPLGPSAIWNVMMMPFTIPGPMVVRTATWFQGEASVVRSDKTH